jgi:hypothetical protein
MRREGGIWKEGEPSAELWHSVTRCLLLERMGFDPHGLSVPSFAKEGMDENGREEKDGDADSAP